MGLRAGQVGCWCLEDVPRTGRVCVCVSVTGRAPTLYQASMVPFARLTFSLPLCVSLEKGSEDAGPGGSPRVTQWISGRAWSSGSRVYCCCVWKPTVGDALISTPSSEHSSCPLKTLLCGSLSCSSCICPRTPIPTHKQQCVWGGSAGASAQPSVSPCSGANKAARQNTGHLILPLPVHSDSSLLQCSSFVIRGIQEAI